ncbi:hypothetical protein JCM19314_3265 [Nonlabens ulvanivorans]|uniref:Uncharacterized protein n=1 Tax=Nonlabens ulvanivorans TaxID=906888 RepID=A0A090Q819_NONUL|nr:hypothetical protein JCM19314_3265 [Nonlabens ulvanivorans]
MVMSILLQKSYSSLSYDNLDFSWSDFFYITVPLLVFIILWQFVIDKWLKKWEEKREK